MRSEKQIVLEAAKQLYDSKLVAGTSGNISLRGQNGLIYITPSSLSYEDMQIEDIVELDINGKRSDEKQVPSSEWQMHLEILKAYPEINAVVHTHSPYATACAVNHETIPFILVEMRPFLGGDIETAPFAPAGSEELGKTIIPFLKNRKACLLGNHGTISVGSEMSDAFLSSIYLEDAAKIYCLAKNSGSPVILE